MIIIIPIVIVYSISEGVHVVADLCGAFELKHLTSKNVTLDVRCT